MSARFPPLRRAGFSGCAVGGDAVELRCHDEVVLVQSLDLFGLQRNLRVTPAKSDVWVMTFGFGERRCPLDKLESLAKVSEPVGTLDPSGVIENRPVWRLCPVGCGLFFGQRRYAAPT